MFPVWEQYLIQLGYLHIFMKLVGKHLLDGFKKKHHDVCSQIDSWFIEAAVANWQSPRDIKQRYVSASILPDNHVIFNLKGNKYRLKVQINYKNQLILIKNIGKHDEYMRW